MRVAARQGETLDAVCWRALGRTAGVVEAAYAANRDLAETGPVLAEGAIVTLPDRAPDAAAERPLVQLWN